MNLHITAPDQVATAEQVDRRTTASEDGSAVPLHGALTDDVGNTAARPATLQRFQLLADNAPASVQLKRDAATAGASSAALAVASTHRLADSSPQARQLKTMAQMISAGRDAPTHAMTPSVQRKADEELLPDDFEGVSNNADAGEARAQRLDEPNRSSLPKQLKSGIEALSGITMNHVTVHYNSGKPAQLHANAYAQGDEIHIAPGQEQHLPHEAWHVVQQAQGRVSPTMQMHDGVAVNDDANLEREADVMGARAAARVAQRAADGNRQDPSTTSQPESVGMALELLTHGFPNSTVAQMQTVRYEMWIPAKRSGYGKKLTGRAAYDWLITQKGQAVIDGIKQRYALMVSDERMMVVVVDQDRSKLEEHLKDLKILKFVGLDEDVADDHFAAADVVPETIEGKISYFNVKAMRDVNHGDGNRSAIDYHYNVPAAERATLSRILAQVGYKGDLADAVTGFANPEYFQKTQAYTWILKPGVSAAMAIRDFMNLSRQSTVIAECQTTAQAVNYYTLLQIVGDERFDLRFGHANPDKDKAVNPHDRLQLQKVMNQNPIGRFFKDFSLDVDDDERAEMSVGGDVLSAPNHRPAKIGGWYFIKNHDTYTKRHPDGFLMGENAFYYGRDKATEQQRFGGLGLEDMTEMQILHELATAFNEAPSGTEVEKIYEQKYDLAYPGIQLPVLGDVSSVAQMPFSDKAWAILLARTNSQPGVNRHEDARLAILAQGGNLVTGLQAVALAGRTSRNAMNASIADPINGRANAGDVATAGAVWRKVNDTVELDRTDARSQKVSRRTLVEAYIKQFNLNIVGGWLSAKVREMNPALFGDKSEMFPISCLTTIAFPLPGAVMNLNKSEGFQIAHAKVLDADKIREEFKLE